MRFAMATVLVLVLGGALSQAAVPVLGELVRDGGEDAVGGVDLPVGGERGLDVGDVDEAICEGGGEGGGGIG